MSPTTVNTTGFMETLNIKYFSAEIATINIHKLFRRCYQISGSTAIRSCSCSNFLKKQALTYVDYLNLPYHVDSMLTHSCTY